MKKADIELHWYPNGEGTMTGYGNITGRMSLAEIADWCTGNGIDPDTVSISGNLRTARPYTDDERAERVARRARSDQQQADWARRNIDMLIERHGLPYRKVEEMGS